MPFLGLGLNSHHAISLNDGVGNIDVAPHRGCQALCSGRDVNASRTPAFRIMTPSDGGVWKPFPRRWGIGELQTAIQTEAFLPARVERVALV